jgi:hypothetical protein
MADFFAHAKIKDDWSWTTFISPDIKAKTQAKL